jgi:hypothetical protein
MASDGVASSSESAPMRPCPAIGASSSAMPSSSEEFERILAATKAEMVASIAIALDSMAAHVLGQFRDMVQSLDNKLDRRHEVLQSQVDLLASDKQRHWLEQKELLK